MNDIVYSDFVILCRETNPKNGETLVYEVKTEVNPSLVNVLKLRSRFNYDLDYFLTHKSNLELTKRAIEGKLLSNKIPEGIYEKL